MELMILTSVSRISAVKHSLLSELDAQVAKNRKQSTQRVSLLGDMQPRLICEMWEVDIVFVLVSETDLLIADLQCKG